MAWQSLIKRGFWAALGLSLALAPAGLFAQGALPAALPEDLLPELRPLLDQALKSSPNIIAANLAVATADANAIVDRSSLYPSLSGYGNYDYTETAVSANSSSKSKTNGPLYGLNLSQPIFQWGALKYQAEFGTLRVRIAEHQYAEAYRTLVFLIRSQYLLLIEKKITFHNALNNVKVAQDNLSLQEARLRDGRISEGEIVEPRLQVQDAQILADRGQEDYDSSRQLLAHLVGISDLPDDKIPLDIPKPTFASETVSSFFDQTNRQGLENTFQYQTFADSIAEDELTYKIQRVRLYPKFNVFASYNQVNQTNVDNVTKTPIVTAVTQTTFGAGASWTIFDGFATRGAKLSALAAKRLAEQQLKEYSATTMETLISLEKRLGFAGRLMDLTDTRRALANAAVEKVGNDVRSGVSPQNLLNTISQNADTATLTAVDARVQFLTEWSNYLSVAGLDPVLNNLPEHYLHHVK